MPNRGETVTGGMIQHMINTRILDIDSEAYALTNFHILAHYAGLRLGKYAQPSNNTITLTNTKLAPKSFILSDFTFYIPGMKHFTQTHTQSLLKDTVQSANARFREKKNGN